MRSLALGVMAWRGGEAGRVEYRCSVCKQVKDVRTLRNSVCPECRAEQARASEAETDHAAGLRYAYEQALKKGPHYAGVPEAWTPKDPVLLADGEHFICPACKRVAHLVHDLSIRWNKKPYPIPNKYSLCDRCHRKDLEESDTSSRVANRFNRER